MRILEVRRHTMRRKPLPHISREGIELARVVERTIAKPFSFVATSNLPRAIETAIAMGFEVDETIEELGILPENIFHEIAWPRPLSEITQTITESETCLKFANDQAATWLGIANKIADDRTALVISHGGIIELGAFGVAAQFEQTLSGDAFGYCEGVRILFSQANCIEIEMLRVPNGHRLISN